MGVEIWKDVIGYEGLYEISSFGNLRSVPRLGCFGTYVFGKTRKSSLANCGYLMSCLSKNGKPKYCTIHRLVAKAFHGPSKGLSVNHIDGNKLNNHASNLEWVTHSDNILHAHRLGLKDQSGEKNNASKLSSLQTQEIVDLICRGLRQADIAEKYGISRSLVSLIKNNAVRSSSETAKKVADAKVLGVFKKFGNKNPKAKLDPNKVKMIRKMRLSGDTYKVIADKFNVSQYAVSCVCDNKTWKHIV